MRTTYWKKYTKNYVSWLNLNFSTKINFTLPILFELDSRLASNNHAVLCSYFFPLGLSSLSWKQQQKFLSAKNVVVILNTYENAKWYSRKSKKNIAEWDKHFFLHVKDTAVKKTIIVNFSKKVATMINKNKQDMEKQRDFAIKQIFWF